MKLRVQQASIAILKDTADLMFEILTNPRISKKETFKDVIYDIYYHVSNYCNDKFVEALV